MGFPKNITFRQVRFLPNSGQYYSGGNGVANRAFFIQFVVYSRQTFTNLRWGTGNSTSGNYDIGIYDANLQALFRKGLTAMPAANSTINQPINLSLAPDVYYIGFVGTVSGINNQIKTAGVGTLYAPTGIFIIDNVAYPPLPADASAAVVVPDGTTSVQMDYQLWFNLT